jgi:thiosulfate reductase / polysulfide reductase chain A
LKSDKAPDVADVKKDRRRTVHSLCGMCSARCPIDIQLQGSKVIWIQGNANDAALGTSLCAKGSAGLAVEQDDERPPSPLIRTGPRGSGQWRRASWEEALDYVAERLKKLIARHGGRGVVASDGCGASSDLTKSFLKAIGSPNYFNQDCTCGANADSATRSLFGLGRTDLSYDFKNARQVVLCGRNLIESLQVKEVKAFMQGLRSGCRCTYIDPRATLTAAKASRYWRIRPNTEYALYLSFIHVTLQKGLYDKKFASRWVTGLEEVRDFTRDKTPEWQQPFTGIPADQVRSFIHEVARDAPRVIFHAGWMSARHRQSFYTSRCAHMLNALFGAIEVPGGVLLAKSGSDAGSKGLNRIADSVPDVTEQRVDGCGWKYPHFNERSGLLHLLFPAIEIGEPYPIGAYIAYHHDPLTSLPDPDAVMKALDRLDLLVAIDVNYSEFAWRSDVILPEAAYLERADMLTEESGPLPSFLMCDQAVDPRFDSRPAWWIVRELARRLGVGQYFNWDRIEDLWRQQLKDTGIDVDLLRGRGVIPLADRPILWDRDTGLRFKTPSGKIEFVSDIWKQAGHPALAYFRPPPDLEKDEFRLLFGRCAVHSQGYTANNPLLQEILPDNPVWIHTSRAQELGIADGELVEVSNQGYSARSRVLVTPWIHPDALFMVHGFGRNVPLRGRALKRGIADQRLQKGMLSVYDPAGGGNGLCECTVRVQPLKRDAQ